MQTKLETDLKEYQQINANLIISLIEITQEIQTEITERITRFMKNFDKILIMFTRIITAEELYIYCRAR